MTTPAMSELLDLREVAALLRVSKATMQRWAKENRLPAVKIGKEFRVRRTDLERWYDALRMGV